ncbi:hypothetical protein LCGC14_1206540 [marine sediment metagenome]|uniref:Uncharacterized protein n=1 Tax=marine sediment metagenome TaxID=412755 RepID=A0A0F9LJQ8_9ZZZZ
MSGTKLLIIILILLLIISILWTVSGSLVGKVILTTIAAIELGMVGVIIKHKYS